MTRPRITEGDLESRYWLTDAGWAAAKEAQRAIATGELDPLNTHPTGEDA